MHRLSSQSVSLFLFHCDMGCCPRTLETKMGVTWEKKTSKTVGDLEEII